MPREWLDALENLPEEAPGQVAFGQLEGEVPRMPDGALQGLVVREMALKDERHPLVLCRRSAILHEGPEHASHRSSGEDAMEALQEFVDNFTYLGVFAVLLPASLGVPVPEEMPIPSRPPC